DSEHSRDRARHRAEPCPPRRHDRPHPGPSLRVRDRRRSRRISAGHRVRGRHGYCAGHPASESDPGAVGRCGSWLAAAPGKPGKSREGEHPTR
ncbi:MAG: hypothetical protein AVDCRST_MAG90-427, partial [uncultured Microvirga sp.]